MIYQDIDTDTDNRPNEAKLEFLSMFVHSCKDKQDTKQEISWIVLLPEILRYSTHKSGQIYKDNLTKNNNNSL